MQSYAFIWKAQRKMRLLLVTSIMQTLCYLKIFRLSKEYSAQIILDGNNQSHKRIGSTSITWPSIQSVKPVKEGFAFIISPNFGSITILFILCKNTQKFSKYQIFPDKSTKKMIFPLIFSGLFVFCTVTNINSLYARISLSHLPRNSKQSALARNKYIISIADNVVFGALAPTSSLTNLWRNRNYLEQKYTQAYDTKG